MCVGGGCENLGMLDFLFLSVMALRGILFKPFPSAGYVFQAILSLDVTLTEKIFRLKFVYQKIYTVICGKYAPGLIFGERAQGFLGGGF